MNVQPEERPESVTSPRIRLEHEAITALVNNGLINIYDVKKRPEYYEMMRKKTISYSDATLHRLIEAATSPYAYTMLILIIHEDHGEETINDRYMLAPVIDEIGISSNSIMQYICALPHYENLAPQRDGYYPPERLALATALTRVTYHLYRNAIVSTDYVNGGLDAIRCVLDEKLRALIITSDDPIGVADLIIARKFISGEQLATYLEATNALPMSLKNGAL